MKRVIFIISFIVSITNSTYCQQKLSFVRDIFYIADSGNYIITADTSTINNITFVINYIDTLNVIDKNNLKQGFWFEYINSSIEYEFIHDIPEYSKRCNIVSFPDIIITFFGQYKDDKKEGKWLSYFANGKLSKDLNYSKGILIGDFYFYYESGLLMMKGKQLNDTIYEVEKYNSEGILISKKKYHSNEIDL